MTARNLAFIRKSNGIVLAMEKATVHMTFDDIGRLNRFIASGDDASTTQLRRLQAAEQSEE